MCVCAFLQESEYRRFKSEGSTVGVFSVPAPEMEVSIDDFSPILDHKMALPNRITLEQPKVQIIEKK